jgi:hypothetical protein
MNKSPSGVRCGKMFSGEISGMRSEGEFFVPNHSPMEPKEKWGAVFSQVAFEKPRVPLTKKSLDSDPSANHRRIP